METKTCATCKIDKPVSLFYLHKPSGTYEKHCKKCKKIKQKTYKKHGVKKSGVPHEQEIIDMLKSRGIYACSGKLMNGSWVDVVAWGCVAIECKKGKAKRRSDTGEIYNYQFTFTQKQVDEGIRGDMLIFMIEDDEGISHFHFLPKDTPALYKIGGELKRFVSYTPERTHGRTDIDWNDCLEDSENNFGLIGEILEKKKARMLLGKEVDLWTSFNS